MKIAYFDVENAPSLGWFYDLWKEGNIVATEQPWFMLSFAWKHPNKDRIHCRALPDYSGYKRDKTNDYKLICDLWDLFNSHDILIGHNIRRFDTRKANARFIKWGLKPPSPYTILDSLVEYRKIAYLDRYGLDFIDRFNGGEGKMATTGWDMHRGAIEGNPACWRMMKGYNKVDVKKAQHNWEIIAPWKKYHAEAGGRVCPNPICGSVNIISRGPLRRSTTRHQFCCKTCGNNFIASPPRGTANGGRRPRI